MDHTVEFTIESDVTLYHPTEVMWYIKHNSGLFLGRNDKGTIVLSDKPFYFMKEKLALLFLNCVIDKTYS